MKEPSEIRAIYNRLRTIAKDGNVFTVTNCITRFGCGMHYSEDWYECIEKLITKGRLIKTKHGYKQRRTQWVNQVKHL